MAETTVEQVSLSAGTPSKITDFFRDIDQRQASPATCVTGSKKPRKGRGRAPAKSSKASVQGTKPELAEANLVLPNGDSSARPAGDRSAKARSSAGAKPKTTVGAKPKSVVTARQKTDATANHTSAGITKKKEWDAKEADSQKPITDFFPVRRSDRRFTSKELKKEREKDIQEKILRGCEDGLEVQEIEDKGRGVIAMRDFEKDEFVVEYAGELVNITTAKQRENLYERDQQVGCYMYYFMHKNRQYCIDATLESGKLGRLLNHGRKGNCYTKVVAIDDRPYLVLLAARHIKEGEELTYDYGDRSPGALESHPWLKY